MFGKRRSPLPGFAPGMAVTVGWLTILLFIPLVALVASAYFFYHLMLQI